MTANDFKDPTLVCYAIENHPCDSRVTLTDNGIVQTLNARMGTGGNNVPLVLMGQNQRACYAVDSHPGDSRIGIAGEISPTLTVKIYKHWGSASVDIAKKNPYRLCNEIEGIGFEKADSMA